MAVNIGVNIQRSPNRINQALREAGVNGQYPKLFFDFVDNYYLTNGSSKSLNDAFTFTRNGNATMVDSDGLIKWSPHNLVSNSENFSSGYTGSATPTSGVTDPNGDTGAFTLTASTAGAFLRPTTAISVPAKTEFTLSVFHKNLSGSATIGAYDLSNGAVIGSQAITNTTSTWALTEYTFTTPAGCTSVYVYAANNMTDGTTVDAFGLHFYRSDLGGMVDNPVRGDSYVPTTSSAVYMPRVGHHKYNGDQWVDKGGLFESEARTNLITHSEDISNAAWAKNVIGITQEADAFGLNMWSISDSSTTSFASLNTEITSLTAGTNFSFSILVKKDSSPTSQFSARIRFDDGVTTVYCGQSLNVDDGTFHGSFASFRNSSIVEDWGTHWKMTVTGTVGSGYTSTHFEIFPAHNDASGSGGAFAVGTHVIGGIQLEAASTPSSYIPTNGSSVTRAAESITVPYANLPWPTPTYIGDELVTNGTFDTDISGWTGVNADASWDSSGALRLDGNGINAYGFASQTLPEILSSSKVYKAVFDIVDLSANGISIRNSATILQNYTTTGTKELVFVGLDSDQFRFTLTNDANGYFVIDNISVREINPLSVSIAMQGEMNYADEDNPNEILFYRWYQDLNNRIQSYLSTSGALVGGVYFYQNASGTADVVNVADIYSPDLNLPFNISSRHGSTFINGAVDGTALTADTTPVALPDLSATDLILGHTFMGTISSFRIFDRDIGDTGIAEATKPSTEPSLSLTFDGQPSSFTNGGLTV